jgi:uncharacterized membrane protein YsdA (DUF1294 family)
MSRRARPEVYHGGAALAFTLALALLLFFLAGRPTAWWALLGLWLIAVNMVTLVYYGYDKSRARAAGRRVPEAALHGLALAGGTLGAYAGMALFRHKTVKSSFRLLFWVIAVLQVLLIAAVLYRAWKAPRPSPPGVVAAARLECSGTSARLEAA